MSQTMQNITLALPKELLQDVKELASAKNISVSKLLGDTLEQILREESGYQHAMTRSLQRMEQGFYLGLHKEPENILVLQGND
ncbi:MAG: CopG family antitoxin [Deinococcales bacterium]